jgi:hypothetical protein
MAGTRMYKKLLNSCMPHTEDVWDRLFNGNERSIGVLTAEINFLHKQIKVAEPFIIPNIRELIKEKISLRSKLQSFKS